MVKINNIEYRLSTKAGKKLEANVNGKWIAFGNSSYDNYYDKTKLLNGKYDHLDKERRRLYIARASKIRDKDGNLTRNDINSPNYHSIHILW